MIMSQCSKSATIWRRITRTVGRVRAERACFRLGSLVGVCLLSTCVPSRVAGQQSPPATGPLGTASPSTIRAVGEAKRDKPFVNSLGMKFVPVSGTRVLVGIWETRVADFQAFVREAGYAWNSGGKRMPAGDQPVNFVSWQDAAAFCKWLSQKEGLDYRLPSDKEWDVAVGRDRYPWGNEFPPPPAAENLSGQESGLQHFIKGWRDNHRGIAPVGSYPANKSGLHDMGGNLQEWCDDWYDNGVYREHLAANKGGDRFGEDREKAIKSGNVFRVVRGGAWTSCIGPQASSGHRDAMKPGESNQFTGFRCVLVDPTKR